MAENSPYGMTGSCILDLRFMQILEVLEIPSLTMIYFCSGKEHAKGSPALLEFIFEEDAVQERG